MYGLIYNGCIREMVSRLPACAMQDREKPEASNLHGREHDMYDDAVWEPG